MDRMIYMAMSGAKQLANAQAVNANNLANVTTTGFRADFQQQRSMPLFGDGHPTRVFAMTERPGTDFTNGPLSHTGRELDIAIEGDGWLAVQARDGTEGYTRLGGLKITPEGILQTTSGLTVLGNGGPIALPPADKIEIGSDGTISILPLGEEGTNLAVIDRIKLVNPPIRELEKNNDGLFRQKDGQIAQADINVRVRSGSLEASNVNVVEALTSLITLSRLYEMQVKLMKKAEDADSRATTMLRS